MDLQCSFPGTRACGPVRSGYQRESPRGRAGAGDAADERRVFLHALEEEWMAAGGYPRRVSGPGGTAPLHRAFLGFECTVQCCAAAGEVVGGRTCTTVFVVFCHACEVAQHKASCILVT